MESMNISKNSKGNFIFKKIIKCALFNFKKSLKIFRIGVDAWKRSNSKQFTNILEKLLQEEGKDQN